MRWILIMWAVWGPDVPVKVMEFYYPTEQACLDAMEQVIDRYSNVEHDQYGYTLQCRPNDDEG